MFSVDVKHTTRTYVAVRKQTSRQFAKVNTPTVVIESATALLLLNYTTFRSIVTKSHYQPLLRRQGLCLKELRLFGHSPTPLEAWCHRYSLPTTTTTPKVEFGPTLVFLALTYNAFRPDVTKKTPPPLLLRQGMCSEPAKALLACTSAKCQKSEFTTTTTPRFILVSAAAVLALTYISFKRDVTKLTTHHYYYIRRTHTDSSFLLSRIISLSLYVVAFSGTFSNYGNIPSLSTVWLNII